MEPSDEPTVATERAAHSQRVFRIELIIATIALVASISASVASVIQTKTLGHQFSASVWPYLVVNWDFDASKKSVQARIRNDGLGPALIRTVDVTLDGKPQLTLNAIVERFAPNPDDREIENADLGGGIVIRAADTFTFFVVQTKKFDMDRAQQAADAVTTRICYCSLLADCWTTRTNATEPKPVRSCGPPSPKISLSAVRPARP